MNAEKHINIPNTKLRMKNNFKNVPKTPHILIKNTRLPLPLANFSIFRK
jgi:hypothetical protein